MLIDITDYHKHKKESYYDNVKYAITREFRIIERFEELLIFHRKKILLHTSYKKYVLYIYFSYEIRTIIKNMIKKLKKKSCSTDSTLFEIFKMLFN